MGFFPSEYLLSKRQPSVGLRQSPGPSGSEDTLGGETAVSRALTLLWKGLKGYLVILIYC